MTGQTPDLQLDVRDGVATLTFDRPDSKVNLLSRALFLRLEELLGTIEAAAERGEARALLLRSGKRNQFIAGADIDELAAMESAAAATDMARRGDEILLRLERLPVPTLAAIAGPCIGGGVELALCCDYRVASDHPSTRIGLRETQLGILPGLGGTVRLPRLIGLPKALDLILEGRLLSARRAQEAGIVDRTIPAQEFDLEVAGLASDFARRKAAPLRRVRRRLLRLITDGPLGRALIKRMVRKRVLRRTRGHYPALPLALEVTVDGLALPVDEALEREAEAFGRLAVTPECKNLIFVYQTREKARKSAPAGEAAEVKRAGVVGAGVMGAGIAELLAYQTIPVQLIDIDQDAVRDGLERARGLLEKAARKSDWSEDELKQRNDCLRGAADYQGLERADLVIEAVVEQMEVKRDVFTRVAAYVRPSVVIATNTSALSVSELQAGLDHPDRVCGLHFFNPPYRMPLVEVVRGARSSPDALATAFQLAARLGKTPVVVADSPGFVVNRVLAAYMTEAGYLIQAGMPVRRVDRVMERFGMPVGPLRLLDQVGLDVVAEVSGTMERAFGARFKTAEIVERVLATGVTGRKGGRGFYRYEDGKVKGVDPEIEAILREGAGARGEPPSDREAEERMVFAMVNEAARILEDGVVGAPEMVDVAMIMGTGFPPFRGGLLRYADSLGVDRVAEGLRRYAAAAGSRLEPASGLLARKSFYSD